MKQSQSSLQNIYRVGIVSKVFPEECAVQVAFPDKDDGNGNPMISDKLPVNVRGSSGNKDYWMPDVGEQVNCLILPNGHGAGCCLGSYYSAKMPPNVSTIDKRRIDFGDGTFIEYDRSSHHLTINCVGNVTIRGARIDLN